MPLEAISRLFFLREGSSAKYSSDNIFPIGPREAYNGSR